MTGIFTADIVLQILSYVSQTERENIRRRQAEGIAIAKRNGKHLGRPAKPIPAEFKKIQKMCEKNEITQEDAANMLGISRATYKRWIDKCKKA